MTEHDRPRSYLPPPSFSRRNHRPCRMAVFPVPPQPADGRGHAGGTRDHRFASKQSGFWQRYSDAPSPGRYVNVRAAGSAINGISTRPSFRSEARSIGTGAPLSRTDLCWRCWCKAVTIPRQPNGLAQAAEKPRPCATRDGDRQASILSHRKTRDHGWRGTFIAQGLNNRAENSHQPIRRRERIIKRFKSRRHLQRFVTIHDPIANLFHISRHDISASHHRELRATAMDQYAKIARV